MGSDVFSHAPEPNAPSLQKVDYQYNIRGWLTHINNTKSLQNSEDPNDDLFAFAINYTATDQDYSGEVNPLYNGNIAETLWRSGSDNVERSYGYKYDAMNRLTNAIYGKPNNSVELTHNYNEWLSYDKNGNILTLGRNGISDSYFDLIRIDNLEYHYESNHSNILIGVNDKSGNTAGFKKDYLTDFQQEVDYEYDDNSNLVADHVKNISSITYNHLNLPVKINFDGNSQKYIEYIYAATGEKLMKLVKHNDSLSNTRYIHGFQYYDNVLQFFHISTPLNAGTPEGYVKNTPDDNGAPSFDYVYQYKDHASTLLSAGLGNVRVNYAQDPQGSGLGILDESHYYPFGLQHINYNSDLWKLKRDEQSNEKSLAQDAQLTTPFDNPGYNYKYNGMELQEEFGTVFYDFGARNGACPERSRRDPALGRWMNVDPLAEKMRRHSPYNYAFNNPIYFIDPDGMRPVENGEWGRIAALSRGEGEVPGGGITTLAGGEFGGEQGIFHAEGTSSIDQLETKETTKPNGSVSTEPLTQVASSSRNESNSSSTGFASSGDASAGGGGCPDGKIVMIISLLAKRNLLLKYLKLIT